MWLNLMECGFNVVNVVWNVVNVVERGWMWVNVIDCGDCGEIDKCDLIWFG